MKRIASLLLFSLAIQSFAAVGNTPHWWPLLECKGKSTRGPSWQVEGFVPREHNGENMIRTIAGYDQTMFMESLKYDASAKRLTYGYKFFAGSGYFEGVLDLGKDLGTYFEAVGDISPFASRRGECRVYKGALALVQEREGKPVTAATYFPGRHQWFQVGVECYKDDLGVEGSDNLLFRLFMDVNESNTKKPYFVSDSGSATAFLLRPGEFYAEKGSILKLTYLTPGGVRREFSFENGFESGDEYVRLLSGSDLATNPRCRIMGQRNPHIPK